MSMLLAFAVIAVGLVIAIAAIDLLFGEKLEKVRRQYGVRQTSSSHINTDDPSSPNPWNFEHHLENSQHSSNNDSNCDSSLHFSSGVEIGDCSTPSSHH